MLDLTDSRDEVVGNIRVRRALPTRGRRTVGAWCFADHMGPADVTETHGLDIGPHPHCGLHTVTWLLEGRVLHRDSLGSEQVIAPGQLNLMTAGRGVSHSEEAVDDYRGRLHGIQLWVAQPSSTRDGPAAFEHHADLPADEIDDATVNVLVGSLGGLTSPAHRDTEIVGAQLALRGSCTIPLRADFEHALIVLDGSVRAGEHTIVPGALAHLQPGRDELTVHGDAGAIVMLLGGVPFDERLTMYWNFVARSRNEVDAAVEAWNADDGRFGTVESVLARIPSPTPFWQSNED